MEPKTIKILTTDVPNANKRIYSHGAIELAASKLKQRINDHDGILGELNNSGKLEIELNQVSHKIEEVYLEGNDLMAKVKILNTPQGKIVQNIIEHGQRWDRISFNVRGLTDARTITEGPNGERVINELDIITFDIGPNHSE